MSTSSNTELLLVAPLAFGIVRAMHRFLDVPTRLPRWHRVLNWIWVPGVALFLVASALRWRIPTLADAYLLFVLLAVMAVLAALRDFRPARSLLLATAPFVLYKLVEFVIENPSGKVPKRYDNFMDSALSFVLIWLLTFVLIARSQKKQLEKERVLREEEARDKRRIEAQNTELERLVGERTAALTSQAEELQTTLTELRTTQAQLVQSEKMASLGELTAGIAHEIQNPLNFVNNFADVSAELLTELEEEQQKPGRDPALEAELLADLKQNLLKISQHGGRAASIVRGMLEHSRSSSGERTPTDLNALADEYLRLAYHGLRAKDKSFNATLKPDFDPSLPPVEVIAQDLGRVLLNLLNNAFYAVRQRQQTGEAGYPPTVSISTRKLGKEVELRVRDNGLGIPAAVRAKIFQPFFTTKPTGEGTGLGLSLSYDIITQGHGGTLAVHSEEGKFTEFVISLPINQAG